MSDLVSLTLPYKGSLPRPLFNYIKKLKEGNKEDKELVEYLNNILQVALVCLSQVPTST